MSLLQWLGRHNQLDSVLWGCNVQAFREAGGLDALFGTCALKDLAAKLAVRGAVLLIPLPPRDHEIGAVDEEFFQQALLLQLKGDMIGLSSLYYNRRSPDTKVTRHDEAVIHYFFGRASLRALDFPRARMFFRRAFRRRPQLKYLVFMCATVLPSQCYCPLAKLVRKLKRIVGI